MRLVGTFKDPQLGQKFSLYLQKKGIRNQVDIEGNRDWGSEEYGTPSCRVWIFEEEDYEEARSLCEEFSQNPFEKRFHLEAAASPPPPVGGERGAKMEPKGGGTMPGSPMGKVTVAVLFLCILLFLIGIATTPSNKSLPEKLPPTPFVTPEINKELLYDYPEAYRLLDKAERLYGVEALENPGQLPPEGQYLLQKFYSTPYWKGLYPSIVNFFRGAPSVKRLQPPLFEEIRRGELWRLFTPALLHYDLFHILFNMLWLIVLGRQMEEALGKFRYLLFILIAAAISNSAQYLMSGSNFIGYSGVISAMILFIWKRQQVAPWEGYLLQRSTVLFVALFVFAVLGVQLISFALEVYGSRGFVAGIANTAHLSGGIAGYLLSKCKFFAWQRSG